MVRPKRLNPRTGKIAVVATYISDYIFPSQLRAVDEVLSENKYTAVLSATRNRVCNERAILEEILKNPVDGILIEGTKSAMPNPNFDLYEKLIGMGNLAFHRQNSRTKARRYPERQGGFFRSFAVDFYPERKLINIKTAPEFPALFFIN